METPLTPKRLYSRLRHDVKVRDHKVRYLVRRKSALPLGDRPKPKPRQPSRAIFSRGRRITAQSTSFWHGPRPYRHDAACGSLWQVLENRSAAAIRQEDRYGSGERPVLPRCHLGTGQMCYCYTTFTMLTVPTAQALSLEDALSRWLFQSFRSSSSFGSSGASTDQRPRPSCLMTPSRLILANVQIRRL
jgi:hypothetical protein